MYDYFYIFFGINVGMVFFGIVGCKQMSIYDCSLVVFDRVCYRKFLLDLYGKELFVGGCMEDILGQCFYIFLFYIFCNIYLDKYVYSLVFFYIF